MKNHERVTALWLSGALFFIACGAFAEQRRLPNEQDGLQILSSSLQRLSEQVSPSVVQVVTIGLAPDPAGESNVVTSQRSAGSGVILDPEGYIVTNAHVVSSAQRVQVLLTIPFDEKAVWHSIVKPRGMLVEAKILGIDSETDLAVLKIEEKGLRALELGDSESLRQGEVVLAFGSPIGLENSVSMGVVSSVARQLKPDDSMIYIQTDASINPGNSGGPLLNTQGKVVGINTMIISRSGGSEGLGFAAPSNIVKNVFGQIRQSGRVRRGQVGVQAQTITPVLAAAMKLPKNWGVILGDVEPNGPADRAGLKVGDIIVSLDGKVMENARQFAVNLYQHPVGEAITVELLRGTESATRTVTVQERPNDPYRFADLVTKEKNLIARIGIFALEIDDRISAMLPPLRKPAGLLVAGRLADEGTAEGLRPGDLIITLNGKAVPSVAELRSALDKLPAGNAVVFQVQRQGALTFIGMEMP